MKAPFFSIVLPTYNRANYLDLAIESVLKQTFQSFELIIVDDGSTDDTAEKVKKWCDERIKYFFKINEERSIARNFGIEKSEGRYINFLDSDDYFYPNHLENAFEGLKSNGYPKLFHSGFEIRKITGELILTRNNFPVNINRELISNNLFITGGSFIKREIFADTTFLPSVHATISEDWYLWIRLAARHQIVTNNTVTYVVVEHVERSLNTLNADKVEKSLSVIIQSLKEDQEVLNFYSSHFQSFVASNFCFIALLFSLKTDWEKARHYLKLARKVYPLIVFKKNYLAVQKKIILAFFRTKTL